MMDSKAKIRELYVKITRLGYVILNNNSNHDKEINKLTKENKFYKAEYERMVLERESEESNVKPMRATINSLTAERSKFIRKIKRLTKK